MSDLQWIFDGIGTAIISAILGILFGGFIGFRIGIKKGSIKQKQVAGDESSQIQIGIKNGRK